MHTLLLLSPFLWCCTDITNAGSEVFDTTLEVSPSKFNKVPTKSSSPNATVNNYQQTSPVRQSHTPSPSTHLNHQAQLNGIHTSPPSHPNAPTNHNGPTPNNTPSSMNKQVNNSPARSPSYNQFQSPNPTHHLPPSNKSPIPNHNTQIPVHYSLTSYKPTIPDNAHNYTQYTQTIITTKQNLPVNEDDLDDVADRTLIGERYPPNKI